MTNEIVAVVTGVTGDIGRAIADGLTTSGVTVIGLGHNAEKVHEQHTLLSQRNPNARAYAVDFEAEHLALDSILETLTHIDWIVHVAGYLDPTESFTNTENLDRTFDINVLSLTRLTALLLPRLRPHGGIIGVSSTASLYGNGTVPFYAASKGALNTFLLSLAQSWKTDTRRSLVLCPGPTNTQMREALAGDSKDQQHPNVIRDVVVRMMHDASTYHNGDIVVVRDGQESFHSRHT